MHPDYFWWGPMWFFPMVIPIIMVFAMVLCLYFMFGRGGFRPPWHDPTGLTAKVAKDWNPPWKF